MVLGIGHSLIFSKGNAVRAFQIPVRSPSLAAWLATVFQMVAIALDLVEVLNRLVFFAGLASFITIGSKYCRRCGVSFSSFGKSLGAAFSAMAIQAIKVVFVANESIRDLGCFASGTELVAGNGYLWTAISLVSKSLGSSRYTRIAVWTAAVCPSGIKTIFADCLDRFAISTLLHAIDGLRHQEPLSGLDEIQGPSAGKAASACGYAYRPWTQTILFTGGPA